MKKLTLSLLCAGFITTTAIAEDICKGAYQTANYQQAAECYVQQLKKEHTFHNLKRAGDCYGKLGRYKEALPYLKEAESKAQSLDDYKSISNYLDTAYSGTGDTTRAFAYSMKFLDLSLKSEDRKSIGDAYSNLGVYYFNKDQPQKALEYYEKALEYQEQSERATTYSNVAVAYNILKNYTKAEEMYQKAVEIDQKIGDYASFGSHKTELGIFYFMQERYVEARATLEEGRTISHNTGNIHSEAHTLSILSIIDYREGHVNEAKAKAAEGLRLVKQSGATGALLNDANGAWNIVNGK